MKLRIQNLGPIKDATIDLGKKLTVFCGPNGTGKTWAAYVMYGVMEGRTAISESLFSEQDLQRVIGDGYGRLEVYPEHLFRIRQDEIGQITQQTTRIFPVAVDRQKELFGEFEIQALELQQEFVDNYQRMSIDVTVPVGPSKLTIHKVAGENGITVRIIGARQDNLPIDFFGLALTERVFGILFNYPVVQTVILPVERNSIYTFGKEVSLHRSAMYERLRDENNIQAFQEAFDYLQRQTTRYPEAIRDALRDADDIANIARSASPFYEFAKDLEQELLNGIVRVGEDGEVNFSSNKAVGKSFSFQLSSSSVKTISSLIIYLKYQAQPADLIIIDEPELNLHPDNQILLARLFARMINQGLRLLISTHSDYIIRELNNLIMLGEQDREPMLKEMAAKHKYKTNERLSKEDVGVYLFHFKDGESTVTVEPVPVESNGFEVATIEDTINRLNEVSEDLFYHMKHGHRHRTENPA